MEVMIASLDYHGTTDEATDQDMLAPSFYPNNLRHNGKVVRPPCCRLGWGSISIGDPNKSHSGGSGGDFKKQRDQIWRNLSTLSRDYF